MSTPLDYALRYAAKGFRIFPARHETEGVWKRKQPLIKNNLKDASIHPEQIKFWWRKWPNALIGFPTGHDRVVLDVDVRPDRNGFKTLADLGFSDLPVTPMVHSLRSGGIHLHFALPDDPARNHNTAGSVGTGIGAGLDWRCLGGYVILPAPDSGYAWVEGREDIPLAPIPEVLLPKVRDKPEVVGTAAVCTELTDYGEAALRGAIRNIIEARNGDQDATLNKECYTIGSACGAGLIPAQLAFSFLLEAARAMPSYDSSRPWTEDVLIYKARKSFRDGLANPRPDAAAVEEAQWQRIKNADESWWEGRSDDGC